MKCITNRASEKHITPLQDAMWHRGIMGMESCVFNCFDTFEATIISNNEIRIASGIGAVQGRFFCVEPGTYDSIAIANGTQGEKRIDLICAEYAVDTANDTQDCRWVVLQGESTTGNATPPTPTIGNIDNGDLITQEVFFEVHIEGIVITKVVSKHQLWTLPLKNGGTGADLSKIPSGTILTKSSTNKLTYWNAVPMEHGGHGATTAEGARKNLGLGAVAIEDVIPITKGGTGTDLNEVPTGAVIAKSSSAKLSYWNVLPISHGGHGATTAEGARKTLNAASLEANSFTGNQTLANAKYLYGTLNDGNVQALIGLSSNNNMLIGSAVYPDRNAYLYGNLNLNHPLAVSEGGTGVTNLADLIKALCSDGSGNSEPAYVIGFNSGYADSGYTSISNLRKTMGLGSGTGALSIANGGTGAVTAEGVKTNLGLKKKVWSGTWASGTVEIPNTDDYFMFMVDFVGHATPIFIGRNGTYIRGTGGYAAANTIELYNVTITRDGDLWTLVKANRLTLNPSTSNGPLADIQIENIWAVI